MQKIFYDTRMLDKAARDAYGLTEDIMMENAAAALEREGADHFFSPDNKYINRPCVLILSGGGNNGAAGDQNGRFRFLFFRRLRLVGRLIA